eukprot:7940273-Pyramimonas_sp.AAC.1
MAHPVGRTRAGEPLKGSRDRHAAAGGELHCGGATQVRDKSWPEHARQTTPLTRTDREAAHFYSARLT